MRGRAGGCVRNGRARRTDRRRVLEGLEQPRVDQQRRESVHDLQARRGTQLAHNWHRCIGAHKWHGATLHWASFGVALGRCARCIGMRAS